MKTAYCILRCYECGRLLLAHSSEKSRTCPYCESRLSIAKASILARFDSSREARLWLVANKKKLERAKHTYRRKLFDQTNSAK